MDSSLQGTWRRARLLFQSPLLVSVDRGIRGPDHQSSVLVGSFLFESRIGRVNLLKQAKNDIDRGRLRHYRRYNN